MKKIRCFILSAAALLLSLLCVLAANAAETEEPLYKALSDDYCAVRGDVDGNGKITAADARTILRASVGLVEVSPEEKAPYVVDDIYSITAADARKTLRVAVGLEPRPPHVEKREYVTQQPTCFDIGIYALQCVYCNDLYRFGALPQLEHYAGGWNLIRKPTCTEEGLQELRCLYCNTLISSETLPKTAHKYGELQFSSPAPDCTKAQNVYQVCEVCGDVYKSVRMPTAHAYQWVTITQPTCTELGLQEEVCAVCGIKSGNTQNLFSFGGHTPSGWVVIKYPTPTEDGLQQKTCTRCGILLEEQPIPKRTVE